MSKSSNTENNDFVRKTRFMVVLIAHTVSDESLFAFVKKLLCIKTLATIIYCIYNLNEPISITSDEIVDAMSERKKNLHAGYGIHGVTDTFKINSTNVFRYK